MHSDRSKYISYYRRLHRYNEYLTSAEEYGVLAVQLTKDVKFRQELIISNEMLAKLSE